MKWRFLTTLLLVAVRLAAQPAMPFRLGVAEGLSNSTVRSLAQDKMGRIWLATDDGLNCFDGNCTTVLHRSDDGLPADELNCLLDDARDSILWIGTQREGLAQLDYTTGRITRFAVGDEPAQMSAKSITSLSPATNGDVLVSTYWGGVCRYQRSSGTFLRYNKQTLPQLPSNQTWTAVEDAGGKLYVGHVYDGLSVVDLKTRQVRNYRSQPSHPDSLHSLQVFAIQPMPDGKVWLGTGRGLDLLDQHTNRIIHYADHHPLLADGIRALCVVGYRLLVTTAHSQIAVIDLRQDVTHPQTVTPAYHFVAAWSNPHQRVNTMLCDNHGNLWTGMEKGGASMVSSRKPRFRLIQHSPYLADTQALTFPAVGAISASPDSSLWVGLANGGINVFSKEGRTHIYNKEQRTLPANNLLMLQRTADGRLWAAFHGNGLYRQTASGTWQRMVENDDVHAMVENDDGTLFVGTNSGVFHIDPRSGTQLGRIRCKVNFIWALAVDHKRQLWVGTFGGGIEVFSPDGTPLAQFNTEKEGGKLRSNTICQLLTARNGVIYAATHEGLAVFNDRLQCLRIIAPPAHDINRHVQSLAEDGKGRIWMGTYRGLACYDPKADTVFSFRNTAGVPAGDFLPASVAQTPDGTLCFGSTTGLCLFRPEEVFAPADTPTVAVTGLVLLRPLSSNADTLSHPILASQLPSKTNIRLSHRDNTLRINFSVQDFALLGQVEYAYRLRGFSDEWYSSGTTSHVEFNNLPSGSYTFEVKARLQGEPWGDASQPLHFRIKPAPWFSPLAIVLYVACAFLIGGLLWWLKHNKERLENALHRRMQEKEQLEQEAEKLKRKATTIREQQEQSLQQASTDNDRQFLSEVSQCVQRHMKEESFSVAQMAAELGMSESTLYRRLKTLTGCSTQEWIRKLRMERALELMLDGKHSISEVGYLVGYSTPNAFRYAFKEEFGVSPKAYIESLQKK